MSFKMTKVLIGHGYFDGYLCRIRKEPTAQCHHCATDQDSAQHTLRVCPRWTDKRRKLVLMVGKDLSLPRVIRAMLRDERSWMTMASFCEEIMLQKEAVERKRGVRRRDT